jgi:hypothetical protein
MARGLTEPVEPEQPEQQGPTNDDIFKFMDQLALHVRDIDTRLSTLEKNLFRLINDKPENPSRPWKKGL